MKNRFRRAFAVFMAAVTAAGIGSISANANSADTDFSNFTIYPGTSNTYTPLPVSLDGIRQKDNSSCVYVYVTNSTYSTVKVQTWGLDSKGWDASQRLNCTREANGNSTTCVRLQRGSKYRINNSIKSNSLAYAGLKFQSSSEYSGDSITGVWSPDYVTESGVLLADD